MGNSYHGTTYMRVGGDDGELRPWHYIYVYSIEYDVLGFGCRVKRPHCRRPRECKSDAMSIPAHQRLLHFQETLRCVPRGGSNQCPSWYKRLF